MVTPLPGGVRVKRQMIPADVKDAIVYEYRPVVLSYSDLVTRYGVSPSSIHRIVTTRNG